MRYSEDISSTPLIKLISQSVKEQNSVQIKTFQIYKHIGSSLLAEVAGLALYPN